MGKAFPKSTERRMDSSPIFPNIWSTQIGWTMTSRFFFVAGDGEHFGLLKIDSFVGVIPMKDSKVDHGK
jgi:hypothetical protein